ncbi:MAG: hypothetical protein HY658_10240 [Actinobacteria bacterium]|nr:hypothetical protein [Actinomycetota bacterium]
MGTFVRWSSRSLALMLLGGLVLLLLAPAAGASITQGPCDGDVTIRGTSYTPDNDTRSNPVVVPNDKDEIIQYHGDTGGVVIENHTGYVGVEVGPGLIKVGHWSGDNTGEPGDVESNGPYKLETAYEKLPFDIVGIFVVKGHHEGTARGGGHVECDGFAMVKIEGNPLATVPGASAAGLAVVSAGGLVAAGRAKRGA